MTELHINAEKLRQILDYKAATLSDEELDNKFVDDKEDVLHYLYQIRYICERHYKSPLANKVEDLMIDLCGKVSQFGDY